MTLDEATGIKSERDVKTGRALSQEEIFGRYIELLGGLDVVSGYIPFSLDVLREKYAEDKNLNNTPINAWDVAAGFRTGPGWNVYRQCYCCQRVGGGLWVLYRQHGITSASCADGVCILKEAARRLIEREVS